MFGEQRSTSTSPGDASACLLWLRFARRFCEHDHPSGAFITEGIRHKDSKFWYNLFGSSMNLASREPCPRNIWWGAGIDLAPVGSADPVQVNCVHGLVTLPIVEAQQVKPW